MILLLSNDSVDSTTDNIFKWIRYLGGECIRINSQDIVERNNFSMNLGATFPCKFSQNVNFSNINVVWFWRWYKHDYLSMNYSYKYPALTNHIKQEIQVIDYLFMKNFSHCEWVGHKYINKLDVLERAKKFGIKIPKTLVTNNVEDLFLFVRKYGECICKPLSDPFFLKCNSIRYGLYTSILNEEDILSIKSKRVFPSLIQQYVEKEYEIRCFYIDNKFYSAAIFSQENDQTKIDFRQYDLECPNRVVPYDLPFKLREKLTNLMLDLGLKTGSIDLIKSRNEYVFLEVNPVGQFEMISKFCNYNIEKIVAQYLIIHDVKQKNGFNK